MAVALTVGTKPQFTFDPTQSVQTMTAFIVQISIGETAQGSIEFKVALRGRRDAVRHHLRAEPPEQLGRAPVPDGVLR